MDDDNKRKREGPIDLTVLVEKFFAVFRQVPLTSSEVVHDRVAEILKKRSLIVLGVCRDIIVYKDPYGGCLIEFYVKGNLVNPDPLEASQCRQIITEIGDDPSVKSVWLIFPMGSGSQMVSLLPTTLDHGKGKFFEDTQKNNWKGWWWCDPSSPCSVPPGATHNLGACGLLYDKKKDKIMLVKAKNRKGWCVPGGNYDAKADHNDIRRTAFREALEETGYASLSEEIIKDAQLLEIISFPENQFAPAKNFVFCFQVKLQKICIAKICIEKIAKICIKKKLQK